MSVGFAAMAVVMMAGTASAQPCERTITLDIRTIDYKSKPYDPMLKPLLDKVDPQIGRIELTFASARVHPDIADLQAAGVKYVQSRITLQGYDPALIARQEVMLPKSFAGKDELYRLIVTYGPKDPAPAC
ncbi:hypothetical protein [Asticcacaulis sp. AND118]|uniref:hypothetical protein n=1 Tax=Asticcacaulis sp. AND118 TaxID=2840468 RepID=UPI001CFFA320|nr:hypothetical protein [Asticcacaulis sp. AND118]UDF05114.1 hypothetical protein LH365_17135 [Asticcacaulis sp. AND118]